MTAGSSRRLFLMKYQPVDISQLSQIPVFANLSKELLVSLCDCCRRVDLKSGEMLFVPDQPAEAFFIILTGQMLLYKLSPDGKRQIVHHLGSGAPFAEAVAFAKKRYPVFAEAQAETSLISVNVECFSDFLKKQPDICLQLLAGVFEKVRQLTNLVEALSLKSVPARLAGILLEHQPAGKRESDWFTLPLNKVAIADSLGTTPETISRALRRFKDAGLIEEGRLSKIRILRVSDLQEIAEGSLGELS